MKKKRKARVVDNNLYITSANPLDSKTIERISQIFGTDYKIVAQVDPNVIGGIKIKQGVKLFDGTVSKHLEDLKKKLYQL